jgi:hypothetical protein
MAAVSWTDSPVMDSLASSIVKGDVREVGTAMKDTAYSDVVGLSFLLLVLSSDF